MYRPILLLELLEYQLVGLLSAFELIAISSSESASMHFTSVTDCELASWRISGVLHVFELSLLGYVYMLL